MVVVDRLSKYVHFLIFQQSFQHCQLLKYLLHTFSASWIPKPLFQTNIEFSISRYWREIFGLSETKLHFSTTNHPQTEVTNMVLEQYLCCFTMDNPHIWFPFLTLAEYSYNTSFHPSTGYTLFQVLYVCLHHPYTLIKNLPLLSKQQNTPCYKEIWSFVISKRIYSALNIG